MTAIAHRLDRKLKTLPPSRAASVEKLVADVLDFVDVSPQSDAEKAEAIAAHRAHWQRMDAILDELDWSDFERPDQGVEETREDN